MKNGILMKNISIFIQKIKKISKIVSMMMNPKIVHLQVKALLWVILPLNILFKIRKISSQSIS